MTSYDWLRTLSLFLWFYNTSATGLVLVYFYGICRLAENKFGGRTYPLLIIPFFMLMGMSTFIFSVGRSIVAIYIHLAIWPALAGVCLFVVVYRVYRLMLGR
ncbi:MAG: hypothetical protein ACUVRX_09830 [Actinomycetota bacterium]